VGRNPRTPLDIDNNEESIWRQYRSFNMAVRAAPNRHSCRPVAPAAFGMPAG